MAADYPDPLPVNTAPDAAPTVAGAVLIDGSAPGPGMGPLVLTSNSRGPSALDFSYSHFHLAELEDLLPVGL